MVTLKKNFWLDPYIAIIEFSTLYLHPFFFLIFLSFFLFFYRSTVTYFIFLLFSFVVTNVIFWWSAAKSGEKATEPVGLIYLDYHLVLD